MTTKKQRKGLGLPRKVLSKPLLHPPLSQVAFEVNFPNCFAVETGVAAFQQKVETIYPKSSAEYIVRFPAAVAFGKPPKATAGELTPLRSFVFQNQQGSRIVRVSVVSFSLIVTDYIHFEDYTTSLLAAFTPAIELFQLHNVDRLGLRYINQIHLVGPDPEVNYRKYVRSPISAETFESHVPTSFLTEISVDLSTDRKLTIRSGLLPPQNDEPTRTYLLDLDCYTVGTLPLSNDGIVALLRQFHEVIEGQFTRAVTEHYLRYMAEGVPL